MNLTCWLMETIYWSKKVLHLHLWLSFPALDIIEVLEKMILSKLRMKVRNVLSIKTLKTNFSHWPKNMINQLQVTFALVVVSFVGCLFTLNCLPYWLFFLIGRKRTVNFWNQRPWRHNCRLYNYHVKQARSWGFWKGFRIDRNIINGGY